jgi:hypothetical protein
VEIEELHFEASLGKTMKPYLENKLKTKEVEYGQSGRALA